MFRLRNLASAGGVAVINSRRARSLSSTSGILRLLASEFEVCGTVQGVFFRKYTQKTAQKLGLVGWVQNTPSNTVVGCIQGDPESIREMKYWLTNTGSPMSVITDCKFRNEREITSVEFPNFVIKK